MAGSFTNHSPSHLAFISHRCLLFTTQCFVLFVSQDKETPRCITLLVFYVPTVYFLDEKSGLQLACSTVLLVECEGWSGEEEDDTSFVVSGLLVCSVSSQCTAETYIFRVV